MIENMNKKKAVLFDFDGTLVDTNGLVIESWQHTYRTLLGREAEVTVLLKTFGEPLWNSMEQAFPDKDTEEVIEIYRAYQRLHFQEDIKIFPQMKETILKLKDMGIKVAIVTSRLRPTTEEGLKKFKLLDLVDAIVCGGETTEHKPNPEPVLLALEKLGVSGKDALMIGDSYFDIISSNRARVDSVLVKWAITVVDQDLQGEKKPTYRIDRAEDILDLVTL